MENKEVLKKILIENIVNKLERVKRINAEIQILQREDLTLKTTNTEAKSKKQIR